MQTQAVTARRRTVTYVLVATMAIACAVVTACGSSEDGSGGSQAAVPEVRSGGLPRFDPSQPAGSKPQLPKQMAFPSPFDAELFITVSDKVRDSAKARGLGYLTGVSNGDTAKMVQQIDQFFARGIGGLLLSPMDLEATTPQAEKALAEGIFVAGVQRSPAHLQISEDQFGLGYTQGKAAADWIEQNLDGKAEVVYFNEDQAPSLIPRHKGVLKALKEGGPGIEVVADVQAPLTTEAAANATNTVLQAHPNANVFLGGSGAVDGAYAALDAKGKGNEPDIYLSAIGPARATLDKIASGKSSYKAATAEPWPIWGWAIGQFAADWLEGKSVPMGMSTADGGELVLDTPAKVRRFQAEMDDAEGTWNDEAKRRKYVSLWGNINYDTRDKYLKHIWRP